mmetsp:Transcript_14394/g.39013  ORF Transcript_14394/g.39013 Transcript_14394/m.39013 type:complete len:106 (+) Transcript_14394:480-797(+)|eukprot:455274-Pelagomonas_calceolata.AAC.1
MFFCRMHHATASGVDPNCRETSWSQDSRATHMVTASCDVLLLHEPHDTLGVDPNCRKATASGVDRLQLQRELLVNGQPHPPAACLFAFRLVLLELTAASFSSSLF